nr:DivIVA domain-containing protein [Janibacter limosus]
MALTPEDVLNKTFTQTQFRRGYDEREVDDFLDEVVAEMRRMVKDSEGLRARAEDGGPTTTSSAAAPRGRRCRRVRQGRRGPDPREPRPAGASRQGGRGPRRSRQAHQRARAVGPGP